ncbi:MAG: hypothetical protein HYT62_00830 [Candidatus Yanofskybacteria bacterium]|nr:hypothetical protein [Candidatus Yanofskybacteria bacterium]
MKEEPIIEQADSLALEKNKLNGERENELEKESLVEYLQEISGTESLSEQESILRSKLEAQLKALSYTTSVDGAGNLWGTPPDDDTANLQREIILCAHMDKVGAPRTAEVDGNKLVGRLDDALGISVILQVIKNGLRPSVLFTVEEEGGVEEIVDGKSKTMRRIASSGRYSNGARVASQNLSEQERKPRLLAVVEVTKKSKPGEGPVIYTSAGYGTPGKQEYFDVQKIKKIAKIINKKKYGAMYTEGRPNDSMIFATVPDMGVIAIEMPLLNMHTANEEGDYRDVEKTIRIVEDILNNADKI